MNKLRVKLISKFRTIMEGRASVSGQVSVPEGAAPPRYLALPATGPQLLKRKSFVYGKWVPPSWVLSRLRFFFFPCE